VVKFVAQVDQHTYVVGVFSIVGGKEVMSFLFINHFILSSTNGQFLNSGPICW
jgi:hypothetical protein